MHKIYARTQAIIAAMNRRTAESQEIPSRVIVVMVMKEFMGRVRRYHWALVVILVAITVISALQVILPWYYKKFFDVLAEGGMAPQEGVGARLVGLLTVIVAIEMVSWILWRGSGFTKVFFQATIMRDLAHRAFAHLQYHSSRFFTNSFVGRLRER